MLRINFLRLLKKQSNNIQDKQRRFVASLEGLGDILVYETSKKTNKVAIVKDGLRKIDKLIDGLFSIQETNEERFEQLVLSGEFFAIQKKDKTEAGWRLRVDPEKYLPSFSVPIAQVVRVFDKAIEVENEEISRNAVYSLIFTLVRVTQNSGNEFFIRQLLRILYKVTLSAVDGKSSSSEAAISHWYPDIVFGDLNQKEKKLKQEYLPILNEYLLTIIKYLIDNDLQKEYKNLIGYFVDGISVFNDSHKVWDYAFLLLHQKGKKYLQLDRKKEIQSLIDELINTSKEISSEKSLKVWISTFQKLKEKVYKHLDTANRKSANHFEKQLLVYVNNQYRLNLLWDVLFSAASYAIFKNKPYFILELWTHKQPDDASASHGGTDLYPTSLQETVKYYFGKDRVRDMLEFLEGHHGIEKYKSMYVMLLLMKYLEPFKPVIEFGRNEVKPPHFNEIDQFELPFNDADELSGIKYRVEQLIGSCSIFTKDSSLIIELGISQHPLQLLSEKLIPFLKHLANNAEGKLEQLKITKQLSQSKINNFFKDFVESFNNKTVIRRILKDKGLYKSLVSTQYSGGLTLFGISRLESREVFLDKWYIEYSDFAKHYADGMALSEDKIIFTKVIERCKEISLSQLDSLISYKDDYIIFVSSRFVFNKLEGSAKFLPKWYPQARQLDSPGFMGWYKIKGCELPVFEILGEDKNTILAVSVKKFGKLVQYSPLNSGEDKNMLKDIFRIKLVDLATSENERNKIVKSQPKWLQEKGDSQQQVFLQSHVSMQIHERFEIAFGDKFIGYYSRSKPET